MKTRIYFLLCLIVLTSSTLFGQPGNKKPKKFGAYSAQYLKPILDKMHKTVKLKKFTTKTCDPIPVIKKIPMADLVPSVKELTPGLDNLGDSLRLVRFDSYYKRYPEVYEHFKKSKGYGDFVAKAFGKNVGHLSKSQAKNMNKFYRQLRNLTKQEYVIYKKSFPKKPCSYTIETKLKIESWKIFFDTSAKDKYDYAWKMPMDMKITTKLVLNCECNGNDNTQLKSAVVYYSGNLMANVHPYHQKFRFQEHKTPDYRATVTQFQCCPTKSTENGSFIDPNQNEPISLPDNFINVSAGVGFAQDFEETSWCIGGSFTHNIIDIETSPLFVGAGASFGNTTFNDSSSSNFEVGPIIELFTPITTSQEVHWVNGVQGNFFTGNQENFGAKNDVSGIQIGFETGLNVMLGQNLAVGVVLPIATWQTTTTQPDVGGEKFKSDQTTLLINKNNPAKISVRFGF